jgi:MFS family permease
MVLAKPVSATGREPMARIAAATMVGTAVEYYDFIPLHQRRRADLRAAVLPQALRCGLPAIGSASDRWGRRRVCLIACWLAAGWAYPFVVLLGSAEPMLILVAFTVALAIGILALVTMGAYLPELFGAHLILATLTATCLSSFPETAPPTAFGGLSGVSQLE